MSSDKHRRELKRKQKKKEEAKRQQKLDRIETPLEERDIECHLLDLWEKEGFYQLILLRRLPSGRHVFASIFIDDGLPSCSDQCVFDRDVDLIRIRNEFLPTVRGQGKVARVPLKQARELVCGAIEWTKTHGFRVAPEYTEAVSILGSLDDILPDYTNFSNEFNGSLADLRKEIAMDQSVARMLRRTDIRWTFGGPPMDHESGAASVVAAIWRNAPRFSLLTAGQDIDHHVETYLKASIVLDSYEDRDEQGNPIDESLRTDKERTLGAILTLEELIDIIEPERAQELIDASVRVGPEVIRKLRERSEKATEEESAPPANEEHA